MSVTPLRPASSFPSRTERRHIALPVHDADGVEHVVKVYSPPARVALAVQELQALARVSAENDTLELDEEASRLDAAKVAPNMLALVEDDDDARPLEQRILGASWDQMMDLGIDLADVYLASKTAMVWIMHDEETAIEFWVHGGHIPKAKRPSDRKKKKAKK